MKETEQINNSLCVVIDTNVLVSAMLNQISNPGEILRKALMGVFVPILTKEILEEYLAVLVRPKFHFPSQLVSTVLAGLMNKGRFVEPASVDVHLPDPKDIIFYAVTLESMKTNETYLVTGNGKHLPVEPFIVTPKELVEILKDK